MEVLSSPSVPLQAPIPLLPHSSRTSLLDCNHTSRNPASSRHSPDMHPSPPSVLDGGATLPAQMSALVRPETSTSLSTVTASATFPAPTRKSNYGASGFLPFVPLTPIMASPRLTPDLGSGPATGVGVGEVDERLSQYVSKTVGQENFRDVRTRTSRDGGVDGYLNKGLLSSGALSDIVNHDVALAATSPGLTAAISTPLWTSTPPTPPQKPVKSPRDSLDNDSSLLRKRSSRSRLNQPRPASLAVFPELRAAMNVSVHGATSGWVSRNRQRMPSYSPECQRQLERRADYYLDEGGTRRIKRRHSLPSNFWKSQSPIPDPTPSTLLYSPATARFPSESISQPLSRSSSGKAHLLPPGSRPTFRSVSSSDLVVYPSLSNHPHSLRARGGSPLRATFTMHGEDRTSSPSQARPHTASGDVTGSHSDSYRTAFEEPSTSHRVSGLEGGELDVQRAKGRRLFHLGADASDGEEAEGDHDLETTDGHDTVEGVRESPHSSEGLHDRQAHIESVREAQGDMKRYHVLMELLSTEVGYLMDLQALVTIYLRHLPSLSIPIPSPSLARSSPSTLSISSLGLSRTFPSSRSTTQPHPVSGAGIGPSAIDSGQHDQDPSKEGDKDSTKNERQQCQDPARKPILSAKEMGDIRRNAGELVKFHEKFVEVLRSAVGPLGFGSAFIGSPATSSGANFNVDSQRAIENVDVAVRLVAEAFAQQANSFQLYEAFCPGHGEVVDLIRRVQDHYPVEWEAYERRCSILVSRDFDLAVTPKMSKESISGSADNVESARKKRRHSTPSLTLPILVSPLGLPPHLNMTPTRSNPTDDRKRKASDDPQRQHTLSQLGRLKLSDYLIKPVQRICKYPLLLVQLKPKRVIEGGEDDHVGNACEAMKLICTLVDEASSRQAHLVKSALIVSRIMSAVPSAPVSPISGPQEERSPYLTSEFLSSLGACLLGGALDVVDRSSSSSRVKYLGTFLYVGGYMVLVKVTKSGKVYEPRYWFSLYGFTLIDAEEDDVFPFSFHLWNECHHLQFAAACQQEKDLWIAAIRNSTSNPPTWVNEPISSLSVGDKGQPMSGTEDDHNDRATPLPTIQSLSDLDNDRDEVSPPFPVHSTKTIQKPYRTLSRLEGSALRQDQPLSRRSSTASVKAFFAFDPNPRIPRPPPQTRLQVDQGLHDVFSENCLVVRSQAQKREEELFQVRKKPAAGMTRSTSGVDISITKRKRHASMIMSSHRRKPSADGNIVDVPRDADVKTRASTVTKRHSLKAWRKQQLFIVPSDAPVPPLPFLDSEQDTVASPEPGAPESPTMQSQCSSATSSSSPGSILPSPLDPSIPLPIPSSYNQETLRLSDATSLPQQNYRPKRTRSMIDNVRYFFQSRSVSPAPSVSSGGSPSAVNCPVDLLAESPGGLMHWFRKGSLRRRVQSSPDVPSDESNTSSSGQSTDDSHGPSPPPNSEPQRFSPLPDLDSERRRFLSSSPKRVAFSDSPPARRRSIFSYSRYSSRPTSPVKTPPSSFSRQSQTLRGSLFHRSPSLNSSGPITQPSSS